MKEGVSLFSSGPNPLLWLLWFAIALAAIRTRWILRKNADCKQCTVFCQPAGLKKLKVSNPSQCEKEFGVCQPAVA